MERRVSTVEEFLMFSLTNLGFQNDSLSQMGWGIQKVVFLCGDIKDLVLEADKHIEFLKDPDALTDDFDGLDNEQVEELKRKCVIIFRCWFHPLNRDSETAGNAATTL